VAPLVRDQLASDDEQVVVCAVGILGSLGQPAAPEKRTVDQLVRYGMARYYPDERGGLLDALATTPALRTEVLDRMARSGRDGRLQAEALDKKLSVEKKELWIPVMTGEIGGSIDRR
jgi:hypothetical protein